jgi:hypothetical protein
MGVTVKKGIKKKFIVGLVVCGDNVHYLTGESAGAGGIFRTFDASDPAEVSRHERFAQCINDRIFDGESFYLIKDAHDNLFLKFDW